MESALHPQHEVDDKARKAGVRRLHEGLHRRQKALLEHGPELREGLEALTIAKIIAETVTLDRLKKLQAAIAKQISARKPKALAG